MPRTLIAIVSLVASLAAGTLAPAHAQITEAPDQARVAPAVTPASPSAASSQPAREAIQALHDAETAAAAGDADDAARIAARVAAKHDLPREVLLESAIALYRVGAYRESAAAFTRVAPFGRGEEHLRYYHAVVLYESGEYAAAQRELACALPFVQVNDEVLRYRVKIERTAAAVMALNR